MIRQDNFLARNGREKILYVLNLSKRKLGLLIPFCSQMVAQAFQPVLTQSKACGYPK